MGADRRPGDYRVALLHSSRGAELELSVIRGRAELANEDGRTPLRAGERAFVRAGAAPSYAYVANSAALDAFDRWSESRRDARIGGVGGVPARRSAPLRGVARPHGYWRDEPSYGRVWYPRVEVGWRPYYHGRWANLRPYGWTWIGAPPVGLADASLRTLGLPGAARGSGFPAVPGAPAWVSWAYAPGYVSWCPLGWNNRPVFAINVTASRLRSVAGLDGGAPPHFGYGYVIATSSAPPDRSSVRCRRFAHGDRAARRARLRRAARIGTDPFGGDGGSRQHVAALHQPLAEQARMQTGGARVRIPDGSTTSGRDPVTAPARERAVPSRPAVRADRPQDMDFRRTPGARAETDAGVGGVAESRRADVPGARPRADRPAPAPGGSPDASRSPPRDEAPAHAPERGMRQTPRGDERADPTARDRRSAVPRRRAVHTVRWRAGTGAPEECAGSPRPQAVPRGPDRAPGGVF